MLQTKSSQLGTCVFMCVLGGAGCARLKSSVSLSFQLLLYALYSQRGKK